ITVLAKLEHPSSDRASLGHRLPQVEKEEAAAILHRPACHKALRRDIPERQLFGVPGPSCSKLPS
ncbi:hypothetical protein, partial [Mesorhizobium sp. M7A.F.Ca.AU.001.01.1.1]|uniref:hypothetical protein n=1 Tax=Mesorhizobium sp. M7A.F.Ca.AU.001.01.1.1 TaxID=2496675 RepID=UPI0019D4AD14